MIRIFIKITILLINFSYCLANDIPKDNDGSYVYLKRNSSVKGGKFLFNIITKVDITQLNLPSCQDMQLNLKRCNLSICYSEMPYGKIYRKTLSHNDDKCRYVERSENFGEINCEIPIEVGNEMGLSIDKLYSSHISPHENYSDIDAIKLKEQIEKYCTIVPYKVTPILFNANKAADLLTISDQIIAKDTTTKSSKKNKDIESTENDVYFKSIVFKDSEIDILNKAIQTLSQPTVQVDNKSIINVDKIELKAEPEVEDLYLNSIIFFSPDAWSIWLNAKKYQQSLLDVEQISVVNVTAQYVELKLICDNLEALSPQWNNKVQQQQDGSFANTKKSVKIKTVRNDQGQEIHEIYLILKPDQTFVTQELEIKKGKRE